MASNPYVNKVQLANGTTLIDLTDTTATAADVEKGKVFYAADGSRVVGTLDVGNTRVFYAECSTAAATQKKAVTITGLTALQTGDIFVITFTNYQNYNGAPTLQINSLTAANIRRVTGTNAARYEWQAGETITFVWNGTYFLISNGGFSTTTYYGRTKLATSATSTSEKLALTPKALDSFAQSMITGEAAYSSSATYEVGDRVRYGYLLYECNTAITTAEAWNSAHWTLMDSVQEQIDAIMPAIMGMTVSDLTT